MGLEVPRQFAALGALVLTQPALVRLLPRMASPVHRQIAAVLENFATELAGVTAARKLLQLCSLLKLPPGRILWCNLGVFGVLGDVGKFW